MPFTVSGVDAFSSKLARLPGRVKDEVGDSLEKSGEDLKEASQEVAPKLSGDLRAQAYSHVDERATSVSLEVGYDGPRDYLLVQHEGGWENLVAWGNPQGPTRITNYTTPGTGPKFLERPWLAAKPRIIAGVKEATRRALKG